MRILVGFIVTAFSGAAVLAAVPGSQPANGVDTHRPTGKYQVCYLALQGKGEDPGPKWMVLALREGRGAAAWMPGVSCVVDAGGMTLADGKLSGRIVDRMPARVPGVRFVYTIEATLVDGEITGTWQRSTRQPRREVRKQRGTMSPGSGTLTGTIKTAAALRQEQAFAEGADWPAWLGPTHDRTATETGVTLIDDLANARPVWKSEVTTAASPGRANDMPRHGANSLYNRPAGNGASPIMADGKVFLNYSVPSGKAYDKQIAEIYSKAFNGDFPTLDPIRVTADDYVVALDAHTGELIFKTVFRGGGANFPSHKNAQNNLTMAYADGRVYAYGSTLRMRCLDAKTGTLIWHQPTGPKCLSMEKKVREGIEKGHMLRGRNNEYNRAFSFAPIVLEGLLIANDFTGGLIAFDAATGEKRWYVPKVIGKDASPHPWVKDGQPHVIASNGRSRITCFSAADGQVRWTIPATCSRHVTVSGDLLAIRDEMGAPDDPNYGSPQKGKRPKAVCAVFRLGIDKAKRLWHCPWHPEVKGVKPKVQFSQYVRPQIYQGKLFLSGAAFKDCYDAETGKLLKRVKSQGGGVINAGHLFTAHGRLFSIVDGKHGKTRMGMYIADADDFRKLGAEAVWVPPHNNTTSYGPYMYQPIVDGRIFIRGNDAIYCYDLRKPE